MRSPPAPEPPRLDLVLVGGGHAHVQVLRRWAMRPLVGVRLTLVVDRPEALYSGMVPGHVAGDYAAPELEIDVVPLARRARARLVLAAATSVRPEARRIELAGRPALPYDVASLDVGSSVRGLELPGVREHALPTRPIRTFVDRLGAALDRAATGAAGARRPRIAVVGAGAAGLELAFTLEARLRARGTPAEIVLVGDTRAPAPVAGAGGRRAARRLGREAERRGIRILCDVRAVAVEKDAVRVAGPGQEGERVACDLAVWATGAAPLALLLGSPLPGDAAGFVRVRPTLQVEGHDDLFAAGDCAALVADPWVPKAGVYAVREGPLLDRNLRARLAQRAGASGRRLARYRPQRDFLALLNLGDRRALGVKWGLAFAGRAVWWLKDRIDRRFVRRFQVLAPDGAPAAGFPPPEAMGMEEMRCGGCAAKVGEDELVRALARQAPAAADPSVLLGLDGRDDAAAWRSAGGSVAVASIDAFRAFCDDPWLVGRVAAVNAASDLYAKGARPRHALALVTVPDDDPGRAEESLAQVLAGVRAGLDPLGVALVGGHSTRGPELFVGLSIHGDPPPGGAQALLRQAAGRPGDALVLTKALGTGVVLAADMQGRARGAWLEACHAAMLRANDRAAEVALACGSRAATDVSGFGLAGHLGGLARASGVSATLALAALPALPGALALLRAGVRSTYHEQNARARRALRVAPGLEDDPALALLFDPQTAGGLLLCVPGARAGEAVEALREAGDLAAATIGTLAPPRSDGAWLEVLP